MTSGLSWPRVPRGVPESHLGEVTPPKETMGEERRKEKIFLPTGLELGREKVRERREKRETESWRVRRERERQILRDRRGIEKENERGAGR